MTTLKRETVIRKNKGFRVVEIDGSPAIDFRDRKHSALREQTFGVCAECWDYEITENFSHRYPVSRLVTILDALKGMSSPHTASLIKILTAATGQVKEAYAKRKARGVVDMTDVERLFSVDTEVAFQTDNGLVGGIIKDVSLRYSFFGGPYFQIQLQVIHAIKGFLSIGLYTMSMAGFRGTTPLTDLALKFMTPELRKTLNEQGEKFAKFYKPGTYAGYKGVMTQPSYWSARTYRADGRVVIDPVSFERLQPEIWRDCVNACAVRLNNESADQDKVKLGPENYWCVLPLIYGFSLSIKQWGLMSIDGLEPIKWRDDAFEKLVLPAHYKELIYSLVKYHGHGFTDIIEGKGGGCIFLLHGEPGLGKTASAEAVAEILHKPLYSVSVGELGTKPDELEANLRRILDVATIWGSVILLDEADIFLEARDEKDIQRNAMVGVFLRLLEYHDGVLFLTTNRVKNIDKAFYSRISVALHYSKDVNKIRYIWSNLLTAAELNGGWSAELAEYDVNGRQIKNAIRMAMTLARAKGRDVELGDLRSAVEASLRFEHEMGTLKGGTSTMAAVEDVDVRYRIYWNALVGLKTITLSLEEGTDERVEQMFKAVWYDAHRLAGMTTEEMLKQVRG